MNIVDQPTYSPKCCMFCRTHEGPFLEIPNIRWAGVPTVEGPLNVEMALALCLGPDDEHQGCVFKLARFAGCALPAEKKQLEADVETLTGLLATSAQNVQRLLVERATINEALRLTAADGAPAAV